LSNLFVPTLGNWPFGLEKMVIPGVWPGRGGKGIGITGIE